MKLSITLDRIWFIVGITLTAMVCIHALHGFVQAIIIFTVFIFACASAFVLSHLFKKWPRILRIVAGIISFCMLTLLISADFVYAVLEPKYNSLDLSADRSDLFANRNVMIIVPHEDDEINIASGLIEEYVKYKSNIRVVFVTNGDYYNLEETRIKEALSVMKFYGIPEEHVIFLGYGDQWDTEYGHIYNAPNDVVVKSHSGHIRTYGLPSHPAYQEGTEYTRGNLLNAMKSLLLDYKPDTIFCVDYDWHCDHKATGLLFEEALGQLLHENPGYTPTVLKGFAYSTGWYAVDSSCSGYIPSTCYPTEYTSENHIYNLDDRVRFPVAQDAVSILAVDKTTTYAALSLYNSQNAVTQASRIVKGDKVFWQRRTDSLLYNANISVSSGKSDTLNDFKLIDTDDVTNPAAAISLNTWIPAADDQQKYVRVQFPSPTKISAISLYDNPSLEDNILNCVITFDDGTAIETGTLSKNGSETAIALNSPKQVSCFTVAITETEGANSGLTEIEAYDYYGKKDELPIFKIINANGDFVYDYIIDTSGSEAFDYYSNDLYLPSASIAYHTDNETCSVVIEGDSFTVNCPMGQSCVLSAIDSKTGKILDSARISNPNLLERWNIKLLGFMQNFGVESQIRYYRDLNRKLKKRLIDT